MGCSSVMSDYLWPHGLQHARPPCPSATPGACSNSCPSSRWCHPTISFCHPLVLLTSIFPSIRVFSNESALHIRWPKYWSFNFSISLFNEFSGWFPLGLTGLISLQSEGLSRVFSSTTVQKHQFFGIQTSLWSNSHICTWLQKKTIALTVQTFAGKVMSSLSNTPPRIVTAFLPRSKRLWISWLQSLFTVILESKKIKPITVFSFPTSFCDEVMGQDAMILVFWMLSFKPAFSLFLSP